MKSPPEMRRAPGKAPLKTINQTTSTEANPTTVLAEINVEYERLVFGTLSSAKRIGELLLQVRGSMKRAKEKARRETAAA